MYRKNYLIWLKIFISIIFVFTSFGGAKAQYQAFDKEKLFSLVPSNTRYVASLSGRWEKSYDESEWTTVNLPYSESEDKRVIYRRTLRIAKDVLQKFNWNLYFLGVDDEVEVYFNNQFVGRYFGSITPFFVKIPPKMIAGETNVIKLVLSPSTGGIRKMKEQNIFSKKSYIGVLRDIILVGTPQIWVSDIKYDKTFHSDYSSCMVNASVRITGGNIDNLLLSSIRDSAAPLIFGKTSVSVEAYIKKLSGENVASATPQQIEIESERTLALNFNINVFSPALWSVDSPDNLYQLVIKISRNGQTVDDYLVNVGFVDLSIQNINNQQKLFVNGKPFEINGVDYIEDYGSTGQTLSAYRMEQDISLIKTLGANVVRFRYTVPHPYMAYLCSKYGLMMMIELPVYDVPAAIIGLDEVKVRTKNIMERLLSAYDNNPAVLGWGLSEGLVEGTAELSSYSKGLQQFIRSSSDKYIYKVVTFGAKTVNTEGFDFVGIRDNRRAKNSDELKYQLSKMKSLITNKPVFVSYGLAIQPSNHNGYSDPLSIESQAHYILNLYHFVKDKDFAGSIIWTFNDYALNNPLLIDNNDNQFVCTTGLVDQYRQQRLSYSTLQSLFNKEKEPLLNAGSYSERTPLSFIIVGILLSIIIIFLINRFRRFREYIFRAILRPYNFYADIRDQRIISSVQTMFLGVVVAMTFGIFISSVLFYYRSAELAQYVLMLILPGTICQEIFFRIIWMPELLILILSLLFFGLIFLISLAIRIFSFFIKARIFFTDTFTITIWAGTPILILLPFSIILTRLFYLSPGFVWFVILLFFIINIWVLFRLLRATSVVFDVPANKTYSIGLSFVILLLVAVLSVYHYQNSFFSYGKYLLYSMINF